MAKWNVGEKNGLWKGGRSVASNGYVLVRVGHGHHLADVRGYAYEHRLVAEAKLGRRLLPGEQVHHIDENKQNNHPANLEVVEDTASHRLLHRKPREKSLRLPGEPNPVIQCACGCGTALQRFDESGRSRLFVSGHNPRPGGKPTMTSVLGFLAAKPTATRSDIAAATGKSVQAVAVCLSKLKRSGLVRSGGVGRWSAVRQFPTAWASILPEKSEVLAGGGEETEEITAG